MERRISKMTINEMAFSKSEAIDKCIELGEKFIQHFHKLYREGKNSDCFTHHCSEMQAWLDKCRRFKLKNTNDYLTPINLIDWFFTAGQCVDVDNGFNTDKEINTYNTIVIILAADRSINVEDIMKQIL